jgi:hypothetical protein
MSKVYFDLSMSLDGFVTGPNVAVGNPLGDDGERLHEWMFDGKTPGGRRSGRRALRRDGSDFDW